MAIDPDGACDRRAMSVPTVSVAEREAGGQGADAGDREQAAALGATLGTCNAAASWLSAAMHEQRVGGKFEAQKRFYTELKDRFGLSAQPAIRVIGKVVDAYTTLKANIDAGNYGPPGSPKRKTVAATPIGFRADAAQPFDARCLSWQIPEAVGGREATVSIWTTAGRLKGIRVLGAARDLVLLRTRDRADRPDLPRREMVFVRHCGGAEAPHVDPVNGFVGVDMGIVNIATSSDGERAGRCPIEPLPQTPTESAETVAGQENQFGATLVEETPPQRGPLRRRHQSSGFQTHRGRGTTHRARYRRRTAGGNPRAGTASQAPTGHAAFVGVRPTWHVSGLQSQGKPAWRSSRSTRPTRRRRAMAVGGWTNEIDARKADFECGRCDFVGNADHNAAVNIAARRVERWGEVMRPHAAPTLTAS